MLCILQRLSHAIKGVAERQKVLVFATRVLLLSLLTPPNR